MVNELYTTVENSKLNKWWVFHEGKTLSTYTVCHILNELSIENRQLKEENKRLKQREIKYEEEIESLKKELCNLEEDYI